MASKPTDPTPAPLLADEPVAFADDRPVTGQRTRHDGWTADRQRTFLTVLAETGCISEACTHAGVSSRSAYRLRQRADAAAFANAWDQALRLATLRLTTIAPPACLAAGGHFGSRAVKGTVREMWREGERVAETRAPSDKLLMFLLQHLLPRGGAGSGAAPSRLDAFDASLAEIRGAFPATLARLADHDVAMVPIEGRDFFPAAPGDAREDW